MKKFIRKLQIIKIDVFIYKMKQYKSFDIPNFAYTVEKKRLKSKSRYAIQVTGKMIHQSYLFDKVFLLKSINKNGPVIGDCYTHDQYRGQAIYPYVINRIAKEVIETECKEVFVIVNQDNFSSIKGIERAGFSKLASIKGTRWLWFYLNRHINYFNKRDY